jgi:hypothetical protein
MIFKKNLKLQSSLLLPEIYNQDGLNKIELKKDHSQKH